MTAVAALSRLVRVDDVSPEGVEARIEATPEERQALAGALDLPAIHELHGAFRLVGSPRRLQVTGEVTARVRRICVATLDAFDTDLAEAVEVAFANDVAASEAAGGDGGEPPDPIVDGRIDLGALTAEFLALGLDPYPRKPDAAFVYEGENGAAASPFAALRKTRPPG